MRTDVDISELPARLNEVLALANAGQEIVVCLNGIPRARLFPMEQKGSRVPNLHPGAFVVGPEFYEPLPEDVWPTE